MCSQIGQVADPTGGQASDSPLSSRACETIMSWMQAVYGFFCEIFFGCSHGHLTRPFTLRAHSYKVCLDCGKQFPYSLEKMRLLHSWELPKSQPAAQITELIPAPVAASHMEEDYRAKAIA